MKMKVNTRYPRSAEYEYLTILERIDLDAERRHDVITGNGFIISAAKAIKDDVKDPNGIFSTKYGPGLQDANAYGNRYRCKCGHLTMKVNHGSKCPVCNEMVEYKGDNFNTFGWITLADSYFIIHPNLFMSIAFFIGEKDFMNIITPVDKKDENGHDVEIKRPKDEPFYGIGMIDFKERFDEIVEYYKVKKPNKRDYYDSIMKDREKVFIQSVPVFTTHLRPSRIADGMFHFEGTNAIYNMMNHISKTISEISIRINRKKKPKNSLLFDLQMKYKELYDEITKIISGKKGSKHVWIPTAKSVVKNLLNCWKAKLLIEHANQQLSL